MGNESKARIEQINVLIQQLDCNEEVQELIQAIGNYLTDAFEAGGDPAHKAATVHLMAAWEALNERTGR